MVTPALSWRVLSRLEDAEAREVNPHLQTDYRISWVTVLHASRGELGAHRSASYAVLGLHPDKVWPAIVARRKAQLGALYENFFSADAARSADAIPRKKASSRAPVLAGVTGVRKESRQNKSGAGLQFLHRLRTLPKPLFDGSNHVSLPQNSSL